MIESIREIPGPLFLFLYPAMIWLGIVVGRRWIDADGTARHRPPEYTRYDPMALAFLRGGVNEVIRTGVFSLTEKGLVRITQDGKKSMLKAQGSASGVPALQRMIFDFIAGAGRRPAELFGNRDLKARLTRQLKRVADDFQQAHLYRSDAAVAAGRMKKAAVAILILGVGLTKLYLGLSTGRPVGFLVILLFLATLLLLFLLKVGRVSQLGKRYLQGLEHHFGWMKDELAQGKQPDGYDPALAVALFGGIALAALPEYQAFAEAFPTRQLSVGADGSGSSGCGGSGCGGSDGGGSDGGGGGCGGCGGGGD